MNVIPDVMMTLSIPSELTTQSITGQVRHDFGIRERGRDAANMQLFIFPLVNPSDSARERWKIELSQRAAVSKAPNLSQATNKLPAETTIVIEVIVRFASRVTRK